MEKLIIIEDDFNLANDLKAQFIREDFVVEVLYDGLLLERMLHSGLPDCIIMDVNIPGINGFDLCKKIRTANIKTPVIMLTAFGEVDDKLAGFESGADDYLAKPFYFKELLARVKALIKRSQGIPDEKRNVVIEDLVIDFNKKEVSRSNRVIKLTAREFEILQILVGASGNPVSKKELIEKVWGTTLEVNTNTIEVFINSLRNKIDKGHTIKLIHTRPGFGYYMEPDTK